MSANPMIIDVDTGVDDAIALALAVASGANLLGVTTVAGNVPIEVATRNTRDVMAYLGRPDLPVHRGASRPLSASYQDATHVHGGNGLGGFQLPASSAPEAALPGPAFILQSAVRHAGELVLVALGPLTNLAIALNVRPELARQVRKLVVMGGAFFTAGNVTPHAEFNVYVDPDAAQQVFDADWEDISLVGLDVTHQTVLAREAWERIPDTASGGPGLVRGAMARTFEERQMSGFYLHDPLAVAVALDPTLVSGDSYPITVSATGEQRGRTQTGARGTGPMVATSVAADRFVSLLEDVLGLPAVDTSTAFERPE
jgi:inosine-uridine nucleoside N-ribohydrolase